MDFFYEDGRGGIAVDSDKEAAAFVVEWYNKGFFLLFIR